MKSQKSSNHDSLSGKTINLNTVTTRKPASYEEGQFQMVYANI